MKYYMLYFETLNRRNKRPGREIADWSKEGWLKRCEVHVFPASLLLVG
jgi:hypothetical protein